MAVPLDVTPVNKIHRNFECSLLIATTEQTAVTLLSCANYHI